MKHPPRHVRKARNDALLRRGMFSSKGMASFIGKGMKSGATLPKKKLSGGLPELGKNR